MSCRTDDIVTHDRTLVKGLRGRFDENLSLDLAVPARSLTATATADGSGSGTGWLSRMPGIALRQDPCQPADAVARRPTA